MIVAGVGVHRDLRAADRAGESARAELPAVGRPVVVAPLRHRRARPRRPQPRPLRRAGDAADRAPRRRLCRDGRSDRSARSPGYFRGPLDGLCMRSTDLVFAFPPIILAMVVAAVLGRSLANAAIAIVIVAWPPYARIVRGLVMTVGDTEYVQSARLLGASARRALVRDVLPNVAGPVLVLMTLDLATAILLLSGLSFLGLGAQPPQAEWGSMVADGTQYFQWWWMGTFPGLAIFTVVLAFNFLGDSLRDVFDPRTGWRRAGDDEPAGGRRAAGAAARRERAAHGRRRRRLPRRAGRGLRRRRRERQRQDDLDARAARRAARRRRRSKGSVRFDGRDLLALSTDAPARARRARPGDGLPGPDDLAPPDAHGRPAAHRARPAPPRARPPGRRAARARAARAGADPGRPRGAAARTRTSSRAGCGSGSRSRSRSPAGRSC